MDCTWSEIIIVRNIIINGNGIMHTCYQQNPTVNKTSSSYILFLFVTRFTDVNVQQYTAINAFKLFVTKKTLKYILYLHSETA
jgi:hypothetical protein